MAKKPTPIERAIAYAGGVSELARMIGEKPNAVGMWKARNSVPGKKVLKLEGATGISRHLFRPDVFGQPPREPTGEIAEAV